MISFDCVFLFLYLYIEHMCTYMFIYDRRGEQGQGSLFVGAADCSDTGVAGECCAFISACLGSSARV